MEEVLSHWAATKGLLFFFFFFCLSLSSFFHFGPCPVACSLITAAGELGQVEKISRHVMMVFHGHRQGHHEIPSLYILLRCEGPFGFHEQLFSSSQRTVLHQLCYWLTNMYSTFTIIDIIGSSNGKPGFLAHQRLRINRIGLREKLQESTIFHGKIYGFL